MFLPSYLLGCLLFHCDFFTPMAEKNSLVDFMVPAIADLPTIPSKTQLGGGARNLWSDQPLVPPTEDVKLGWKSR